jgi:hypothetical protein|uniref:SMODS and SLOG-associating 2TM effector domain-containing protein n=1 Tax=viral metagenome TaxID=1070528 RepID=A0A6C0BGG4_9ZZZZ
MSEENGVQVINGTDPKHPRSRSTSPVRTGATTSATTGATTEEEKPKRFLNGWTKEQERLMAEWSDIALCYRWIHDRSEKHFHSKTIWINLPVIILSTLGGTASFGVQSIFSTDSSKQLASFVIGGISLMAGLLTTIGNYLRYAQLEESNRVASIAWGKFQRLIAVEIALHPNERIDSLDFLKICRADLDRLIEQSPPIPVECIQLFEQQFGHIKDLKKPDICGSLEHTRIFESSEERLKQVAVDAALLLRQKKNTLNELLAPQIQTRIKEQVETRIREALEEQKTRMMKDMEEERIELQKSKEDFDKMMENRQKKIQEEIELEKKRMVPSGSPESVTRDLPFEKRFYTRKHSTDSFEKWSTKKSPVLAPTSPQSTTEFLLGDTHNTIIIPNPLFEQVEIQVDHVESNEHKN